MTVIAGRGGCEDQHPVWHWIDVAFAPAHVCVPELEGATPSGRPCVVQIEENVDPPPPTVDPMMRGEVGVDIEESAGKGLVKPTAIHRQIRDEFGESGEVPEEPNDFFAVQRSSDGL